MDEFGVTGGVGTDGGYEPNGDSGGILVEDGLLVESGCVYFCLVDHTVDTVPDVVMQNILSPVAIFIVVGLLGIHCATVLDAGVNVLSNFHRHFLYLLLEYLLRNYLDVK